LRRSSAAALSSDDLQFRDAIHEQGDFRPELRDHLLDGDLAVLDDVVQQARREGGFVHLQFRQDLGDLDGMDDVGLAAAAFLAVVLLEGEAVRAPHQIGIGLRAILCEARQDAFQLDSEITVAFAGGRSIGRPLQGGVLGGVGHRLRRRLSHRCIVSVPMARSVPFRNSSRMRTLHK
jgi:hypothetical protein